MQPLNGQTWGSELLELCQEANLLILNGRTDEQSQGSLATCQSKLGHPKTRGKLQDLCLVSGVTNTNLA